MRQKRTIPFKITSIDSLGQGVSKETDKITFIPKTLPNEIGTAELTAEKKGVAFARTVEIKVPSPKRVAPYCIHYDSCPSCHFQHTDYEQELEFKKEAMEKLFFKIPHPPIETIGAPERFHYRNRVQLHYDLRKKLLGMLNAKTGTILPIPSCQITHPKIKNVMDDLYHNNNWAGQISGKNPQGHVELYLQHGEVKISWNKPYADGGFTQVFEAMNERMKNIIEEQFKHQPCRVLDLFAGNGNISNKLNYSNRLCVDIYPSSRPKEHFLSQNLYADEALKKVQNELKKSAWEVDHLLLDPPRSGMKDLGLWTDTFKPKFLTYVSCDPHTLVRDLMSLKGYAAQRLLLLDFFPATFHFESLIFLERKD